MKLLKIYSFFIISLFFACSAGAKTIEYKEDAYLMQAPQEIVELTDGVASLVGFEEVYEVMVPKKAGIEINPWNKFVSVGINPQTKNPFIIINPSWISQMPSYQQTFILGRAFECLLQGSTSLQMKLVTYFSYVFSLALLGIIFLLLSFTSLRIQPWWARLLLAFGLVIVCELVLLDRLMVKLRDYYMLQHANRIHESALQKTLVDRDAAVKALEFLMSSVQDEVNKGDRMFAPYAITFAIHANELRK